MRENRVSEISVEQPRYVPPINFDDKGDLWVTFNRYLEEAGDGVVPEPAMTFVVSPDCDTDPRLSSVSRWVLHQLGAGLNAHIQRQGLEESQRSAVLLAVGQIRELTRPRIDPS